MRDDGRRRIVPFVASDTVQAAAAADTDLWARAFAALYDPFLWVGERAGLAALRRDLLGRASGRTVELGSGTGLNLRHFPDDLDELILTEPEPAMRARLARRLRHCEYRAQVLDASAERLPFADETMDTIVSTFVLCTVDAPELALREIQRVLRPGGRLLFLEHVRAESPRLAYWQDRLHGSWRRFAEGCHCNRATVELIRACGLELGDVQEATWRAMPPIVRPLVAGVATKPTGTSAPLEELGLLDSARSANPVD
jgi:SAM-dependent methyltransferase